MFLQNCTLYFPHNTKGTINRVNVLSAHVYTGLRYGGFYNDATEIRFLVPGQRGLRNLFCASRPFVAVLARKDAIAPDPLPSPAEIAAHGYPSFESILVGFIEKLQSSGVRPLFADLRIRAGQPRTLENFYGSALALAS